VRLFSSDCAVGVSRRSVACIAPAIRLERAMRDLYRLEPVGLPEYGPLACPRSRSRCVAVLPVAGENLHQILIGPVHAGIIEPGHFRFICDGETVVRLE
jgi:hypothetical protein